MAGEEKFALLRKVLRAIGLSPDAIDELIGRVVDLLSEKPSRRTESFPYQLRDGFLSPAEHSYYHILRNATDGWALVCPKVSLGDLFYVKASDYGERLTYTNKIDRKHVDFLLCHPVPFQSL